MHNVDEKPKWCSYYGSCMKAPQKIGTITTIWYSNSTSGYFSKRIEIRILKGICTPTFIRVLFTIAKM